MEWQFPTHQILLVFSQLAFVVSEGDPTRHFRQTEDLSSSSRITFPRKHMHDVVNRFFTIISCVFLTKLNFTFYITIKIHDNAEA